MLHSRTIPLYKCQSKSSIRTAKIKTDTELLFKKKSLFNSKINQTNHIINLQKNKPSNKNFLCASKKDTMNTMNIMNTMNKRSETNQKTSSVEKTINTASSDFGLKKFLLKTYGYMGAGIIGSVGIGYLTMSSVSNPLFALGAGFVGSIVGIICLGKSEGYVEQIKQNGQLVKYMEYPLGSYFGYGMLIASMGLLMGPPFGTVNEISTTIIPIALACSSLIFSVSSLYAYYRPKKSLLGLEMPLMNCLFGFVGMGLLSLVSTAIVGPNMFSGIWHTVDLYGGIALFSLFIAYDTQKAVDMYESGNPDHIYCSVNMFLDFINVFIRMLEIISKLKSNN